ncbi:MAG: hypothetical protein ACRDRJ_00700 [Streptosporangiaceae bacterium]
MTEMPQILPDPGQLPDKTAETVAGVAIGVAIAYYVRWQRYVRNVGVENSSARGFRIWEAQQRALLRAQQRLSQATYRIAGGLSIFLFFLISFVQVWNPGWVIVLGVLVVVTWVGGQRRRPPAAEIQKINDWHRSGRYAR